VNQADKTNVVECTADNAAPITDPTHAGRCKSFVVDDVAHYDEETAQITDNDGRVINRSYKRKEALAQAQIHASFGYARAPQSAAA